MAGGEIQGGGIDGRQTSSPWTSFHSGSHKHGTSHHRRRQDRSRSTPPSRPTGRSQRRPRESTSRRSMWGSGAKPISRAGGQGQGGVRLHDAALPPKARCVARKRKARRRSSKSNAAGQHSVSGVSIATAGPAFTVGHNDGAPPGKSSRMAAGQSARVKVKSSVERVPNLKTALIWGTLPGATDETIYIMAHRDGWFDAAGDNASGVASMVALAEHFGKVPQAQRHRTMISSGSTGTTILARVRRLVTPGSSPTVSSCSRRPRWRSTWSTRRRFRPSHGRGITERTRSCGATPICRSSGTRAALRVRNSRRSPRRVQAIRRDHGPVSESDAASQRHELVLLVPPRRRYREYHHYFHTDLETPQTVPWTGLEASTRAYAKIVDEVNKLPLSTLQRPEEPNPRRQTPTPPTSTVKPPPQ